MKKRLLTPILFLIITQVFGQSGWPPIGAKWHYSYRPCSIWGCDSRVREYIYFEAVKDTSINDTLCTKIIVEYHNDKKEVKYLGDEFIYSTAERVYNYHQGHFFLLYDFSLQVGDTIELFIGTNSKLFQQMEKSGLNSLDSMKIDYVVSKRNDLTFGGINTTSIDMDYVDEYFSGPFLSLKEYPTVKNIGNIGFLFGTLFTGIESGIYGPLRCYSDSTVNYTTDVPCELLTSAEIVKSNPKVWAYPNPVTSNSVVVFPNEANGDVVLEILNSGGKVISTIETCDDHIPIGPVNLSKGVFFYRVLSGNEVIGSGRFLKN